MSIAIGIVVAVLVFVALVWTQTRAMRAAKARGAEIERAALADADRMKREAAATATREGERLRGDFEREHVETMKGLEEVDRLLTDREKEVERRASETRQLQRNVDRARRDVRQEKGRILAVDEQMARIRLEERKVLLGVAGLTEEAARRAILDVVEAEVRRENDERVAAALTELREDVDRRARRVATIAIERCNFNHFTNSFSNIVDFPSPEIRERLIGKDKQNQLAFEQATGVTLVFDETDPSFVVLSAFDGTKKAVAKRALEKLLANGAIHPGRIREAVDRAQREVKKLTMDAGRQLVTELNMRSVHAEIIGLLGRLHFRTSYGQNQLAHIREVAYLSGIISAEIGLDPQVGRRSGLLHDIGKAVDSEVEGGHPEIGAAIAKRCGESDVVVNAIAAHHEDVDRISLMPVMAQVADAISGGRPGARRETLDRYLMHMEGLETIAKSKPGVETAFAIQAGREIRVMVNPEKVSDEETEAVAKSIAREIEEKLTYPGKIKVWVIRETRCTSTAH
ncbi:MAG: ribonuclease Y [Planctomycetes bacterium]|nr:ribonuclease Y [Planctomycetota bacterium]MBI3846750.1 ribonuclease Y [Planctomycetota bacterium]